MEQIDVEQQQQTLIFLFKQARHIRCLTQADLSKLSGIALATIQRFESGKHWLNLKQYIILAHNLQMNFLPSHKPRQRD